MAHNSPNDSMKLKHKLMTCWGEAMFVYNVAMGDQLGLYKAMQGAGNISSQELADKTGLDEVYLMIIFDRSFKLRFHHF
jgi:hypothetical protein